MRIFKKMLFFLLLLFLYLNADSQTVIPVGSGPEDMVLDTFNGKERILISCNSRRKYESYFGEIVALNIANTRLDTLKRFNDGHIFFNPHGIDVYKNVLFIVNHDNIRNIDQVLKYKIDGNNLILEATYMSPLMQSPNDILALNEHSFYVSEDGMNKPMNILFSVKSDYLLFFDGERFSKTNHKVCFGNGLHINNQMLFRASTRSHYISVAKIEGSTFKEIKKIRKVKGPDNLTFDGTYVWVAGHSNFGKFFKHIKNSVSHTPTTIYRIDPKTLEASIMFYDSGFLIDGASTAIAYNGKLYMAGIFDPELLIVDLKTLLPRNL